MSRLLLKFLERHSSKEFSPPDHLTEECKLLNLHTGKYNEVFEAYSRYLDRFHIPVAASELHDYSGEDIKRIASEIEDVSPSAANSEQYYSAIPGDSISQKVINILG